MLYAIGIYFSEQVWTQTELISWHEKRHQSGSPRTMQLEGPNVGPFFPQCGKRTFMHMLLTDFFLCSIDHQAVFSSMKFFPFPGGHVLWVNADPNNVSAVSLISAESGFHMMLSIFYDLCCVVFLLKIWKGMFANKL